MLLITTVIAAGTTMPIVVIIGVTGATIWIVNASLGEGQVS
jgi:hypothetical protein